jgi:hypothetical protein
MDEKSLNKNEIKVDNCPDPEKLVQAARLKLPLNERMDVIEHMDICRSCAQEFQTIIAILRKEKEFLSRIEKETSEIEEKRRPWFVRPMPVLAAASAVFLAAAAAVFFLFLSPPEPINLRNSGNAVQVHAPVKSMRLSQLRFAWKPSKGAEYYRIIVYGDDLQTVWESGHIFVTEWTPGPEIKNRMQNGQTYFWMVTAYSPDGSTAESDLIRFSLK